MRAEKASLREIGAAIDRDYGSVKSKLDMLHATIDNVFGVNSRFSEERSLVESWAARPKRPPPPIPVATSDFLRPLTKAQLMGRRA